MRKRQIILYVCLLCFFAQFHLQASARKKCTRKSNTADYIVVGVGTAGAVVAKRLTDSKKNSVIALHVGENLTDDPLIKYSKNAVITVPAAIVGPPLYENGLTLPQIDAFDRELLWAIAQPEGGASSINAGAYCRGTNQVYSQWEAIAGPLWSVSRIEKIYKKLEKYNGETTNPATRGYRGPIDIRQDPDPTEVALKFTQATIAATGQPFVLDYNDPQTPIGVSSQLQYTQKGRNGRLRVSSATAFLNKSVMTKKGKGVGGRKLRVNFNSTALRTLWSGNTAIGVEYLQNGKIKQAYAKKGVIVCAGLRSSPFLLYSGIGPSSVLQPLGIPVIYENPNVGQNLTDQPAVRVVFSSNPLDTPLETPNGLFAQISWLPAPGGDPNKRELRIATINPIPGITLATLDLCQPLSRGFVTINSPNPLDPIVVDLRDLSNPSDLNLFELGLSIYIQGINQQFQSIDPTYQLVFPDPAVLQDPLLLRDFIKENVACNEHFQSHCLMAPLAQGGVVDSTGHVYGVNNLIVADNSIVPLCMDGSPMATGFLIGAQIAQFIIDQN